MDKTLYKILIILFILLIMPISIIESIITSINIAFKEIIYVFEGKTYSQALLEVAKEGISKMHKVKKFVDNKD